MRKTKLIMLAQLVLLSMGMLYIVVSGKQTQQILCLECQQKIMTLNY